MSLAKAKAFECKRLLSMQMEALGEASAVVFESDDIHQILQVLVDKAREITGARYAALGIQQAQDINTPFNPWVFSEMSDDDVRRLGVRPPRPVGLLRAVIQERSPIRLRNMAEDPRFQGLPPGHPLMTTFLGVPIQLGNDTVGNFYLTEKANGEWFTDDDERAMVLMAQQATIALSNAEELSERNRVIAALAQSESNLAEAQALAHVGGWEWDIKQNLLQWSDEIYRIFGVRPREFAPSLEDFFHYIHPDDRNFVNEALDKALHEKKPTGLTIASYMPTVKYALFTKKAACFATPMGNRLGWWVPFLMSPTPIVRWIMKNGLRPSLIRPMMPFLAWASREP